MAVGKALETLEIRMTRSNDNARLVAEYLAGHPKIARVHYLGFLKDGDPRKTVFDRQFTAPGSTFRHTARELLALSAWRVNDATAARKWLDLIAGDGETPPSLRSRADALQALLPPVAKS